MTTLVATLVASLRNRVSQPARDIDASLARLRNAAAKNARALDQMRGRMLDAVGMGYALAKALSAPIKAATEFQSAMADINKVVNFDAPDGLAKMSKDILVMSRSVPMAANGIAQIVAAAGQAGMAGDELLKFAEMAAKVGVAFDISADQAGENLAKIKTALGLTVGQTSELADVLNHLSNTSASSATDLLDFMRRVGAAGLQYGFAARETAAVGSAMVAAGAQADVAATSFRNVGRALARGESATKRQDAAYSRLGLNAVKVAKRLQKDAVGTLNDVLLRIRALPKEVQASTVSDLFGDEARAIMPLIENVGLLKQALGQVADETKYLGSAQREYEVRSKTFANSLQLFQNRLTELSITIGNALLPPLTRIMEVIQPLVTALADMAAANPAVTASVVGLASALIGLKVAAIGARFAFLFLKGGVLDAAVGVTSGASMIAKGASSLGNLAKMVRAVGLSMTLLSFTGGSGLFASLVSGATAAAAAVAGLTAPVWGLVAAVAAVGLAIFNYWEPIREFVIGFASAITEALGPVGEALSGFASKIAASVGQWATKRLIDVGAWLGLDEASVRGALSRAKAAIGDATSAIVAAVKAIPSAVGDWFSDIFSINDYTDAQEAEYRGAGRRVGLALVEGVKQAFEALWEWLKSIPSKIVAAIGKIDLSGLISWPKLPSLLGGGGPSPAAAAAPAVHGARAIGGPIVAGRTYLTGERGPELITPNRNAYVHDNKSSRKIMAGAAMAASVAGGLTMGDVHVHVYGVQDPVAIAEAAGHELRSQLAGLQADSDYSVS